MSTYFITSVLILAVLLFIPTSRLIMVFSVRRLEKKLGRSATEMEVIFQRKRARVLSVLIVIIFSFLFCSSIGIAA